MDDRLDNNSHPEQPKPREAQEKRNEEVSSQGAGENFESVESSSTQRPDDLTALEPNDSVNPTAYPSENKTFQNPEDCVLPPEALAALTASSPSGPNFNSRFKFLMRTVGPAPSRPYEGCLNLAFRTVEFVSGFVCSFACGCLAPENRCSGAGSPRSCRPFAPRPSENLGDREGRLPLAQ